MTEIMLKINTSNPKNIKRILSLILLKELETNDFVWR